MKKVLPYFLATILGAFGLLTLFLSTSVIFDLFGIRAKEGNYVLFVVWANFISSVLYLVAPTGSLGQGLSVANGMAQSAKISNQDYRTYVIMGDGEVQEGQIWEAAMTSAHYKLDNICAILDSNNLQIDGNVEGWQKAEVRRQKSEDRSQKTEGRRQKTEVRRQKTEDRRQKTGDRSQKTGDSYRD